ncbi:MAG: hypothetical protein IJA86_00675 [Clostridia bacterium]|nr:hypothetical protein [Clostridia bacterium]
MENNCKKFPKFDGTAIKNKAKEIWATLNSDNIEVTLTTSAMGLLFFALGLGVSLGLSRCITKAELKSALRKQKKALLQEKTEE